MTDKHITVDTIRWQSVLPWLHLLRAGRLALRLRVWFLGTLAAFVFGIGSMALEKLPFIDSVYWGPSGPMVPTSPGFVHLKNSGGISSTSPTLKMVLNGEWKSLNSSLTTMLFWPTETVSGPVSLLDRRWNSWSKLAHLWTWGLFALIVWGVVAGAMTRMIGVRFARDESVSLRNAFAFSVRNWQSYVYGPLLPMLGVLLIAAVGSGFGWLSNLCSSLSPVLATLLGAVPTMCGLAMSALLLLTLIAWPLMVVAVSVEGSDGFDGLSRAFGYVMNRPLYLVFLVLLAKFVAAMAIAVPWVVCETGVWFLEWSLHWSAAEQSASLKGVVDFWMSIAHGLQIGAVVSFFWSATTVIYFLLRQSDDGTPLDQVYVPGPPPKAEPLPLVGLAASQQPVIERPTVPPVATSGPPVVPEN